MRTCIHIFLPSLVEICKAEVAKTMYGIPHIKNVSILPLLQTVSKQ